MNTYSAQGNVQSRRGAIAWGEQHQAVAAVTTVAAAVLAGLLIGILLSAPFSDAQTATLHRAGGHALATVAQAQHAAAATVATVTGGEIASPSHIAGTRSPARGGFAVGRTSGAGSGFIVVDTGTRAPARGGFSGRSIGAGD
jgi:hypothetical protein